MRATSTQHPARQEGARVSPVCVLQNPPPAAPCPLRAPRPPARPLRVSTGDRKDKPTPLTYVRGRIQSLVLPIQYPDRLRGAGPCRG